MGNSFSVQQQQEFPREQQQHQHENQDQELIPGLPDTIALHIFALVPRSSYPTLSQVSNSWNSAITSTDLSKLRRKLGVPPEDWLYLLLDDDEEGLTWLSLNPQGSFHHLPPLPEDPPPNPSLTWLLTGAIPKLHGCSMAKANGFLYAIGGFFPGSGLTPSTATSSVWRYDPVTNRWSGVSPMTTRRGCCKTGSIDGLIYAIGGYSDDHLLLSSAEAYDPVADRWTPVAGMRFPGYHRELVADPGLKAMKPIASSAVELGGKLWVTQCFSPKPTSWPIGVGGEVYDPATDTWSEMPRGASSLGWIIPLFGMAAAAVVGGRVLSLMERLVFLESCNFPVAVSEVVEYEPRSDAWLLVVDVPAVSPVPLMDLVVSLRVPQVTTHLLVGWNERLHLVVREHGDAGLLKVLKAGEVLESGEFEVVATRSVGASDYPVACQVLSV